MSEDHSQSVGQNAILKELSDIKTSLAVNTNETKNIKQTVQEIQSSVKEIHNDYVSRREFDTSFKDASDTNKARFSVNEKNIDLLLSYVKWIVGIVGTAVVGAILKLVVK